MFGHGSNHIHPFQPKMFRRCDHVAVASVNLLKSLFSSAGEVEGVPGAKEKGGGHRANPIGHSIALFDGHGVSVPKLACIVLNHLTEMGAKGRLINQAVPPFSMESSGQFYTSPE